MSDSRLRDLSVEFSVEILKLCETIKGHSSLVNQLERSSTSIGANIHEANYAHGRPDFIAKLQIALKECYETEYWLEIFVKAGILEREEIKDLYNKCGTIRRLLVASVNTAKNRT
ncbi:MAG: four helix bundle protein [Clostridia bacterium]|nr:four helix bundle protein [Clostridia bacterium]